MNFRISLLMLPVVLLAGMACAQQAPPEVDAELRARVSGLYKNFLDSSFTPRKAEPFVAEDTKDYFYNALKLKYLSFEIGKITYNDDFTKAVVVVVGKQREVISGQSVVMDTPQSTHWKIEDGKWCWTFNPIDYPVTPMSTVNPAPATGQSTVAAIPKDNSPAAIRAAGLSVLGDQPMRLDKNVITIDSHRASTEQIVFTNGAAGDIQIALDGPVVRGLTAKLDKMLVPGHGTAKVTLSYDPADQKNGKDIWEPKGSIEFRIVAAPFNRVYSFIVMFSQQQ